MLGGVAIIMDSGNKEKPWLFKKGQSGNPKGRIPGSKSLKERAREYLKGPASDFRSTV